MFSDEKIFDGDWQLNSKNDVLYAGSRELVNNIGGFYEKENFLLKVMVWCGLSFNGTTRMVVLPEKTSFDSNFYVKIVLPVIKEDGIQLIGDDFFISTRWSHSAYQQICQKIFPISFNHSIAQ